MVRRGFQPGPRGWDFNLFTISHQRHLHCLQFPSVQFSHASGQEWTWFLQGWQLIRFLRPFFKERKQARVGILSSNNQTMANYKFVNAKKHCKVLKIQKVIVSIIFFLTYKFIA